MKVLLIGDFSDNYDEGLKNISKNFFKFLSINNEIDILDIKKFSIKKHIFRKKYDYDIIHYFSAPTTSSLIFLKILSYKSKAKLVISALHPDFSLFLKNDFLRKVFKKIIKTDLVLYQSDKNIFSDIGQKSIFFPNGVDLKKFKAVDKKEKLKLREKYGIDKDKFVLLHVGHMYEKRNLKIFNELQQMDSENQVIVVSGKYLEVNEKLWKDLETNGCKVILEYLPNVEEVYGLADCYIFPVLWGNTINIPLSILEALAMNLPVICLDYSSLSYLDKSLHYVEDPKLISKNVLELKNYLKEGKIFDSNTQMLEYSWKNLSNKLEAIYLEIINH